MTADDGILKDLFGLPRESYGSEYSAHLLDQYRLYVEMADRISQRRHSANTYFLTVNTVIVSLLGLLANRSEGLPGSAFLSLGGIAGMLLSFTWYRLIVSYRQLNSGKFKVIHALESQLPVRPYDAEWTAVGRGENPKLYRPFTAIETWVPWVFLVVYLGLALFPFLAALATG